MCGGSIVHRRFVITELGCAQLLVSSGDYITVLVGQDRRTIVGFSPSSQTRRVVSLKVTSSSNVVLAQVSEEFVFNEHVNNLCLEDFTSDVTECFISGATHSSYANTVPVTIVNCTEGICIQENVISEEQPINWAGWLLILHKHTSDPVFIRSASLRGPIWHIPRSWCLQYPQLHGNKPLHAL